MTSVFVSSPAEVVVVDSRTRAGTITLPVTNAIPYRVINFKDQYGSFSNSTLTISTQTGESFDDGTTSKIFSNAFTYLSLYAVSSKWMVMNATQTVQQTISSLTVNQLTFGTGAGWVQFGPVQATVVSSIQENTQTAYIGNLLVGNLSTVNSIQYYGLFGNYNNTVLAEVSTGAGTQELLVFKGSSASDRVRFQTTGDVRFETGVSARLWSNTTIPTLSNVTPAMIINTSSNVGIQTASPGATLDVAGTGRFVTLSSQQLFVSSINGGISVGLSDITSTVRGLGSAGYISSANLSGIVSTSFLNTSLTSTTIGLGSIGYVSSASLASTTLGLQRSGFISSPNLLNLVSTQNLSGLVSTPNLLNLVSTSFLNTSLISTTLGLQQSGFISSPNLLGLVSTPNLLNLASTAYVNTQISSFSTALGSVGSGNLTTANLTSTVAGLGTIGYASTTYVTGQISSFSTAIASAIATGGISATNLTSTVAGLGSINYISTTSLISTVAGLGTSGYVSSLSLNSTIIGFSQNFSSFSTAMRNNFNTVTSVISALTVSSLTFGTGDGFLAMPDIRPLTLSTQVVQTSSLTAFNFLIGTVSSQTAIQYWGLLGNYNNTVLAEQSTGTGTQEFLVFRGSSTSDQIRFQTTGAYRVETGVSSRLWPNTTQNATPAFIIDTASNVGIQNASPQTALDVTGTIRAPFLSTQQLNISSINLTSFRLLNLSTGFLTASSINLLDPFTAAQNFLTVSSGVLLLNGTGISGGGVTQIVAGTGISVSPLGGTGIVTVSATGPTALNLTSTSVGLGTIGYVSTLSLVSTSLAFQTAGFISSPNLLGLVSTGFLNTSLVSSIEGLGTAGYVSTASLLDLVSTPNLIDLVSTTYLNTTLNSTVIGLGSIGYLSSTQFGFVSTGATQASTFNLLDPFNNNINYLTVSSGILLLNGTEITGGGGGGAGVSQLIAGTGISLSPPAGTGIVTVSATGPTANDITSTIQGLGTAGYASTSYVTGQISSFSTSLGSVGAGNLTTANLTSTVAGLGTIGYASTSFVGQAISSFSSVFSPSVITVANMNSTITGLATFGYISSLQLRSTVAGLGQIYVSTATMGANFSTFSTSISQNFNSSNVTISTLFASNATMSNLTVSTITFNTGDGFIDFPDIRALSLSTFFINTSTINVGSVVSTQTLEVSSIIGPNLIYISNLTSTTAGITTAYQTSGFISTPNLIGLISSPNLLDLVSTTYLTTTLRSSVEGLGTIGYISTTSLFSTVSGLGTTGYVSSLSNLLYISAQQILASSIFASLAGPTTVVLYDV